MSSNPKEGVPVPCLHRIHSDVPKGPHAIHQSIGMSLEFSVIHEKLTHLNNDVSEMGLPSRSVMVTFDDGWVDSLLLIPLFKELQKLQPVLFLTTDQMRGNSRLLPLPRLYSWCDTMSISIDSLSSIGISREQMKALPEQVQHQLLDDIGIPDISESNEIIQPRMLEELKSGGWIIASHAHDHHDLRVDDPHELRSGLEEALSTTLDIGGTPWLAWPEGRCNEMTCKIAEEVGFTEQFSLNIESGAIDFPHLVHRELW